MNSQSTLLSIIGVFILTATCSGQCPSDKKLFVHFAADIIKVDSIFSNIQLHNLKCNKDSIRFESNPKGAIRKENPFALSSLKRVER
jgi:hypothetical protein